MKCIYCGEDSFISEDDVDRHIVEGHPEYSPVGDMKESRKTLNYTWAFGLTGVVYGQKGNNKKEEVLETFKYFLRELMKSEG
jgi:hypothetical protein